jgi:hypothetical protein
MEFKKGDRIICIKVVPCSSTPRSLVGEKGTVMDNDDFYPDVLFDNVKGEENGIAPGCFTMINSELELLNDGT